MSKFLGLCLILLAACATGVSGFDRETAPHARPRFEIASVHSSDPSLPLATHPRLPSAVALAPAIHAQLAGVASVEIELCVAPDGHVQGVNVLTGSSLAAFDAAVKNDVMDWQFSGMNGSSTFASNLRTCEIAKITYRPHR